jgi:arylsulfatase A-like enzyme
MAMLLREEKYLTLLFGFQHEKKDPQMLGFDILKSEKNIFCDSVIDDLAVFIKKRAARKEAGSKRNNPFFAAVGFFETHRPFKKTVERSSAETHLKVNPKIVEVPSYLPDNPATRLDLSEFCSSVNVLDQSIGNLLEVLDETGQTDNTLVIFTVDHGIAFPRAKSTLYDPGLKTALLMRWPNRWKHQVHDTLLSNIDLLPTLLEVLGASIPSNIQGTSFLNLLDKKSYEPRKEIFAEKTWHDSYDPIRCIRTKRYKLIQNFESRPNLVLPIDIEASLTRLYMGDKHLQPRPALELYDLLNDPYELNNLAKERSCKEIRYELSKKLLNHMIRTTDPILNAPVPRPMPDWIYGRAK